MKHNELNPSFTVDDIRILRERNHERRKDMTFDEYWADVDKGAESAREMIKRLNNQQLAEVIPVLR